MKTTLDVDQVLIAKAKEILGTRTLKDTVEHSLRTVVRQEALERLAGAAGTVALDLTVQSLRRQRRKRTRRASC
jgi:Arc/MetJ family transcription regulator